MKFEKITVLTMLLLVTLAVGLWTCGTSSSKGNSNSNSNSNFNWNTNSNSNANFNFNGNSNVSNMVIKAGVVEPAVVGICRVYADKLVLFCDEENDHLTHWHLKAFDSKDFFLATCINDEFFKEADEESLRNVEFDINEASNCNELIDTF